MNDTDPATPFPTPGGVPGHVALVGAGPGDPDLWTVRAVRLVGEADLVLYDALTDVDALRGLTSAQLFFVGKRAGRASVDQETINRLMIRAAKRGRRVVRLKGGDPFVFGRGGEEMLALAEAGVSFEVVPGVTTAVAAPGFGGDSGHASRRVVGLRGGGRAHAGVAGRRRWPRFVPMPSRWW